MARNWLDQFVKDGTVSPDQLAEAEEMAGNLRQPKEDISGLHDGESMPKVMELVVLVALRNCRYKINLPGFKKSDSCLHKVTLCVNRLQC